MRMAHQAFTPARSSTRLCPPALAFVLSQERDFHMEGLGGLRQTIRAPMAKVNSKLKFY